jgi:hypothetical protein
LSASFVVYVDESGDEGFSFSKGSSGWFVLSAVVTRKASDLATTRLVDTVRSALGRPDKKPLHFRDIRHEHRLPFIHEISGAALKVVSVLVHKPSIKEPEAFQQRYRLYYYACRYLLERVSWYCRDHKTPKDTGDGSAEIIFSNRSGMSYLELKDYLEHLRKNSEAWDVRIEWRVVQINQVTAFASGRKMGLQIADAVAMGSVKALSTAGRPSTPIWRSPRSAGSRRWRRRTPG